MLRVVIITRIQWERMNADTQKKEINEFRSSISTFSAKIWIKKNKNENYNIEMMEIIYKQMGKIYEKKNLFEFHPINIYIPGHNLLYFFSSSSGVEKNLKIKWNSTSKNSSSSNWETCDYFEKNWLFDWRCHGLMWWWCIFIWKFHLLISDFISEINSIIKLDFACERNNTHTHRVSVHGCVMII